MTHVVGVDSGGMHTNIRVRTPDGTVASIAELNASLSSNRSDKELADVLLEVFGAVADYTGENQVAMWINAAGYSTPTRDRFEKLLSEARAGFAGLVGMANDAVSISWAHDPELVVVVAGTGSVAMARTTTGEVVVRGGNEWVVADYGSGFWIGLMGLRAAYHALEGGRETALRNSLSEHFAPSRSAPLSVDAANGIARDLAALGTATKPKIAAFAQQVLRQAEGGDRTAQEIVTQAANELAEAAARVYRELAWKARTRSVTPSFLLSGSVAFRAPFYYDAFQASLDTFLSDVREAGHELELNCQPNGLTEAVLLAQRIADGKPVSDLDTHHPYTICQ